MRQWRDSLCHNLVRRQFTSSHGAIEFSKQSMLEWCNLDQYKKRMNKMLSYGQFDFVLVVSAPDLSRKESCSTTQGSMDI